MGLETETVVAMARAVTWQQRQGQGQGAVTCMVPAAGHAAHQQLTEALWHRHRGLSQVAVMGPGMGAGGRACGGQGMHAHGRAHAAAGTCGACCIVGAAAALARLSVRPCTYCYPAPACAHRTLHTHECQTSF